MKILVYRWKAYNYADIIANLQKLGHQVDELEYKLTNYDEDPEFETLLESEIQEAKQAEAPYDFVFTVNYFACIAEVCETNQIFYVCWTCDNPLISMYHTSVFSPYNIIFTFDKSNELEFLSMGVQNMHYLNLKLQQLQIKKVMKRNKELN
jgi:spore maturation protein CgeB